MKPAKLSSPRQTIFFGLAIVILAFGGFISWALNATLAKGIVASGSVVVDSKRKTVQHFEGGIIKAIHIRDGSVVKKGDILLELDQTLIRAEYNRTQTKLFESIALLDRLRAQESEEQAISFSQEIIKQSINNNEVKTILLSQKEIFDSAKENIAGEKRLLRQRIAQLNQKIQGLQTQKKARSSEIKLIKKELFETEKLSKKKLIEVTRVLERQKELARVMADIERIRSDINNAKNEVQVAKLEISQLRNKQMENIANQVLIAQKTIFELRQKLSGAKDVLKRMLIRSPYDGIVLGLITNTVGGVIKPGSPILEIIPNSDELVVEAQLRLTDIDNVYIGMPARMRFSAFKQRTTPEINGCVQHVSADVLINSSTQLSYYLVRIIIPKEELRKFKNLSIVPGMPVEVLMTAESRTPMDYLLDPIVSVLRKGMKEE